MRWGVSKAGILYRGRQLGMFTEQQVKAGYIHLNRRGEATREQEDALMPNEQPEVVAESLKVMKEHFGIPLAAVAREMCVGSRLLENLVGDSSEAPTNVISLLRPHSGLEAVT